MPVCKVAVIPDLWRGQNYLEIECKFIFTNMDNDQVLSQLL